MDHYHIWCNLRAGVKDMDFVAAAGAMLDHLKHLGALEDYTIGRRKLGFGPAEIGEFHIDISVRDLAQLDQAFGAVTPRTGDMERLHAAVWSRVVDFRSALYRDFPDPGRA